MKINRFLAIVTNLVTIFFLTTSTVMAQATSTSYKLPRQVIAETHQIQKKSVEVLGSKMAYLETGTGEPVIFIHGNPTSSYLWRNVMPYIASQGRAIAVDLIGMGQSGKPDISYTFEDQYRYFSAFVDALNVNKVTLVGHDWGATLAWEYARRNPERVRRLAFMEGVLPPAFPVPSFESMGEEMGNSSVPSKTPSRDTSWLFRTICSLKKSCPVL